MNQRKKSWPKKKEEEIGRPAPPDERLNGIRGRRSVRSAQHASVFLDIQKQKREVIPKKKKTHTEGEKRAKGRVLPEICGKAGIRSINSFLIPELGRHF